MSSPCSLLPLPSSIAAFFLFFLHSFCFFCCSISAAPCQEHCGSTLVPFPFRLSHCGRPDFQLQCNNASSRLEVQLHNISFPIMYITSQALLIDSMRGGCGKPNIEYFSFIGEFSYAIPNSNYFISKRNALMMYNCNQNSSCGCDIRPEFDGVAELEQYFGCPNQFCCGLTKDHTLLSLMKNCTSFVSWSINSDALDVVRNQGLNIQVQYGLELEAWIPGTDCICSENADCLYNKDRDAHTCQCKDSFSGDGFAMGLGCSSNVSSSCRRDALVGCTRNIILLSTGVVVGTFIIAAAIVTSIFLWRRRNVIQRDEFRSRRDIKEIEGMLCHEGATKIFAYKDLEKATKGFCDELRLGNGAFGTVYAGKLSNGTMVAVKRINYRYMQGIQQVVNEVKVLTAVKHPNLVSLLGCCLEFGDPLLVYEYVPNGTLSEHLRGERNSHLTWSRRVKIALETAQALAYLHSLDPPIYHRDVKSSNILLGYDFTSKVADFGLSRLVLTDTSHISTVPQGTPGYVDPEYHQNFHLSDKSDVYSFGVVLAELITGMKAVDFSRDKSEVNLASLAVTRIGNGTLDSVIDPSLEADKNPQVRSTIQTVAEIAYRCLSHDKDARPTINEVAQELEMAASESKKLKVNNNNNNNNRLYPDRSKCQLRSLVKEASARVMSVSSSSTEAVCGSNESSSSFGVVNQLFDAHGL